MEKTLKISEDEIIEIVAAYYRSKGYEILEKVSLCFDLDTSRISLELETKEDE